VSGANANDATMFEAVLDDIPPIRRCGVAIGAGGGSLIFRRPSRSKLEAACVYSGLDADWGAASWTVLGNDHTPAAPAERYQPKLRAWGCAP
jgi:hypothetical protein